MYFWTALIRCCILDIERARHMIRGNTVLNNAEFNQNPGSVQKQLIILYPLACTVSQILLCLLATTIPQLLVRPLPSTDAYFKSDGTLRAWSHKSVLLGFQAHFIIINLRLYYI
jgi:hypothetical protein